MSGSTRYRSGNGSSKVRRSDIDFDTIGAARRAVTVGAATAPPTVPQAMMMPYSPFQNVTAQAFVFAAPCMMMPVSMPNMDMPISGPPPAPQQPEFCSKCFMREMNDAAEEMHRSRDKLHLECAEDALGMALAKIKVAQDANSHLQNELQTIMEEHSSLEQHFKKLGKLSMDADSEHVAKAKAILARLGGKCERIHRKDGTLHDMSHAVVAQHRKMAKLLEAMQQRHNAARQTFETAKGHLKRREQEAIDEKKNALRECAAQERRARQLTADLEEHQRSITATQRENGDLRGELLAAIDKNAQLNRKYLRAKRNATTFFDEKKQAINEREDAIAARPMCSICFEKDTQLMLNLPCGHVCTCKVCASTTAPCAICRGEVTQLAPAYFVSG